MCRALILVGCIVLPLHALAFGWGPGVTGCGPIDTSYAVYAGGDFKVDRGVAINGVSVEDDDFSGENGLGTDGSVESADVDVPALVPGDFPANASTSKIDEDDSPLNGASEVFVEEIDVDRNSSFTFTGEGPFHISSLKVDSGSTINFSAGTYFFNQLDIKRNTQLNFAPKVRLHVGEEFKIESGVSLNGGGAPENLLMFLHEDATFESDRNTVISSVIVGVDNDKVKLGSGVSFTGLILAEGEVELGRNMQLNLSPAQSIAIGNETTCDESAESAVDHFVVLHDNNGINCVAEAISIAVVDASGDPILDYTDEVTITTQSGKGSFSLAEGSGMLDDGSVNDGIASYMFDSDDEGTVSVLLSYPEGPATLDVDVFLSSDATLRDDDSEASLVFSPSGFTLTRSELPNPPPATINDPLSDQTAGASFEVHIAAYGQSPTDPVCGVIEAYDGDQSLAIWMDYANPSSGTIVATIDGQGIAPDEASATSQTVTFTEGQASVTGKYKDVGQIQFELKDDSIRGATSPFVVRPADFRITEVTDSLGVANPGATSVTGTGFVTAGELFRVAVEVQDAEGDRTPNYGNETPAEGINIVSANLLIPAGGVNGSLNDGALSNSNAFSAIAPAGTFRNTALSWDELGVIQLQASVGDGNYLGSGPVTGSVSGNVGRFTPANFVLANSALSGACGNSTYMSQPALGVSYQVEARGAGNNVLKNYDVGLLGAANVAALNLVVENNNEGVNRSARLTLGSSSWVAGIRSLNTSIASFSRAGSPDGPFNSLRLGVQITDPVDGLGIAAADMNATTANDCSLLGSCNAAALLGSTSVVYGRLEVLNAFGPETEALNVGLQVSAYAASGGFFTYPLDSCSSYLGLSASLGNYQEGLPAVSVIGPASPISFTGGKSAAGNGLLLSSPGATNTGSVDITYDAPSWLEYDWNGTGDADPVGTAMFGQYRGHDKVIYWREVY